MPLPPHTHTHTHKGNLGFQAFRDCFWCTFWGEITTVAVKPFLQYLQIPLYIGRIDIRNLTNPINDYSPAIAVGLFYLISVAK